jgi:hypothetical protein
MSNLVDLECPRCGNTQKDAWFNRKICCSCRIEEEKAISRAPKGKAWATVTRAIKAGELVRRPCEICGSDKSQAHHDDYAQPLDIRWLCRSHHKKHHDQFGPGKNAYAAQGSIQ